MGCGAHNKQFGVIVGPTGTGKSAVVRNVCNKDPEGTLYVEVTEPGEFVQQLAHELNLKIVPSNILDIALSYYSSPHKMYYSLKDNQTLAFNTVVQVLREQASKFQKEKEKVPTLFIDGADLLAKHNEDLLIHLLMQAKILANDGKLTNSSCKQRRSSGPNHSKNIWS